MPTYEYACRSCGEELEVVQSFSDPPRTDCPACDGPLRKVFSPVGIAFKGTGFYKTDSRSSSARNGSSKDAEKPGDKAAAKSGDTAGPKTEAKPGAKPGTTPSSPSSPASSSSSSSDSSRAAASS